MCDGLKVCQKSLLLDTLWKSLATLLQENQLGVPTHLLNTIREPQRDLWAAASLCLWGGWNWGWGTETSQNSLSPTPILFWPAGLIVLKTAVWNFVMFLSIFMLCVWVKGACRCHCVHVGVREELSGVYSLLPWHESLKLNSRLSVLLTEPPLQPEVAVRPLYTRTERDIDAQ